MMANNKLLSFYLIAIICAFSNVVMASKCGPGEEPTLKIVYEAEDYVLCRDPRLASLPPSTPRGITKAVLYQSKTKRRKELTGQCVILKGMVNGNIVYKNREYHTVKIRTKKHASHIDMVEKSLFS